MALATVEPMRSRSSGVRVGDLAFLWLRASSCAAGQLLPLLVAVRPRLEVGTVDGHGLTKVGIFIVEAPRQRAVHVSDIGAEFAAGELGTEAGEGGLARDFVGRADAAGVGNERVVFEGADEVGDGFQAQIAVRHVASPQDFRVVSFGATPLRACELYQEFFIGKLREDCLKLGNDGRELSIVTKYSIMRETH